MPLKTSIPPFLGQMMSGARFEPDPGATKATWDENLQGLRVFTALLIAAPHIIPESHAAYRHIGAGRGGVLLFFIISGYVLGLMHIKPWRPAASAEYWKRRVIRFAPLYYVCLAFSVLIAWWLNQTPDWWSVIGHGFLLQNFHSYGPINIPPLWVNPPLWNMNYELVYAAGFLFIWKLRPGLVQVFGACGALAATSLFFPSWAFIIPSYAVGFVFFLVGLTIAWRARPSETDTSHVPHFPLAGLLLLLIGTFHAAPGLVFHALIGYQREDLPYINIADFAMLPVCVFLLGGTTRRLPAPSLFWKLVCIAPPLLTIMAALATNASLQHPRWAVATGATILGSLLLWTTVGSGWLRKVSFLGTLSYGFYLFQQPVYYALSHIWTGPWFMVTLATVLLTTAISWLLTRHFEQWRQAFRIPPA